MIGLCHKRLSFSKLSFPITEYSPCSQQSDTDEHDNEHVYGFRRRHKPFYSPYLLPRTLVLVNECN